MLPEERTQGQEFLIDISIEPTSDRACVTDDLADAVDYGAITEAAIAIASGDPVDLIEHLADRIATDLLGRFPLRQITVTVHKPHAPIDATFGDVAVTVRLTA